VVIRAECELRDYRVVVGEDCIEQEELKINVVGFVDRRRSLEVN
jgi:hypothetical protein